MKYLKIIHNDLVTAMKAKDRVKMRTLRSILSKLQEKKIEKNEDLDEKQEIGVIKKEFKNRKESFVTYSDAGRDDLATQEKEEMDIIKTYLPEELSESKITKIIREVIKETGAKTMRDMGKVMKPIMEKIAGQADGKVVQAIVKNELEN